MSDGFKTFPLRVITGPSPAPELRHYLTLTSKAPDKNGRLHAIDNNGAEYLLGPGSFKWISGDVVAVDSKFMGAWNSEDWIRNG